MAAAGTGLLGRATASLLHPEHGWKTTHFWGPVANWMLVGSAAYDASFHGPENIDLEMTGTMIGFSSLFMGFALQVQPRNLLLFSCHGFNVAAQCNQLRRAITYKLEHEPNARAELTESAKKVGGGGLAAGLFMAAIPSIRTALNAPGVGAGLKGALAGPAGPLTVFFWAPMCASRLLFMTRRADRHCPG